MVEITFSDRSRPFSLIFFCVATVMYFSNCCCCHHCWFKLLYASFSRQVKLGNECKHLGSWLAQSARHLAPTLKLLQVDCGLEGEIPREIGLLHRLQTLSIMQSPLLVGTLPSEVRHLVNLMELRVVYSGLSGKIPSEIENCSALVDIYLSKSHISGEIP